MNFTKEVGYRIKKQRKKLGYTQKDVADIVAEKIEISEKQISCIERGTSGTTLENFTEISIALGKTPDYFLLGVDRTDSSLNNTESLIIESLKLCTPEDIENILLIVKVFSEK